MCDMRTQTIEFWRRIEKESGFKTERTTILKWLDDASKTRRQSVECVGSVKNVLLLPSDLYWMMIVVVVSLLQGKKHWWHIVGCCQKNVDIGRVVIDFFLSFSQNPLRMASICNPFFGMQPFTFCHLLTKNVEANTLLSTINIKCLVVHSNAMGFFFPHRITLSAQHLWYWQQQCPLYPFDLMRKQSR